MPSASTLTLAPLRGKEKIKKFFWLFSIICGNNALQTDFEYFDAYQAARAAESSYDFCIFEEHFIQRVARLKLESNLVKF